MPKNKGKGGKTRRKGKKNYEDAHTKILVTRENEQEYAYVIKMLGNGRLEAFCYNSDEDVKSVGKKRLCHIRGNMRKRVWVSPGDTILVGLRSFQDSKADVIHKYSMEDVHKLKRRGQIPNVNMSDMGISNINMDQNDQNNEFEFNIDDDGENENIDLDKI